MLVTLETGTPFISIILNIFDTFQHKTLLNRPMFHIGKDFLQITLGYYFLNRAVQKHLQIGFAKVY